MSIFLTSVVDTMNKLFPYERFHFKSQYLLDNLPSELEEVLRKNQRKINFKSGETIFKEGMYPAGVFVVLKGSVKKVSDGYIGKEHIFYFMHEKEMLGYHSILSNEPYCDTAIALEPCTLLFIPKEDFLKTVRTYHTFANQLLENLSHEFGVFVYHSKVLAQHSVRERTALCLLILKEKRRKVSEGNSDLINLSREDVANYIGTVKETLVRVLREFKDENLIRSIGNSIEILDTNGLIKASNYK